MIFIDTDGNGTYLIIYGHGAGLPHLDVSSNLMQQSASNKEAVGIKINFN
jgi:hypothetical protein